MLFRFDPLRQSSVTDKSDHYIQALHCPSVLPQNQIQRKKGGKNVYCRLGCGAGRVNQWSFFSLMLLYPRKAKSRDVLWKHFLSCNNHCLDRPLQFQNYQRDKEFFLPLCWKSQAKDSFRSRKSKVLLYPLINYPCFQKDKTNIASKNSLETFKACSSNNAKQQLIFKWYFLNVS